MGRKRRPEEPENHERWLISYADFITLLFAFFVVMYAISSVNEGKYRVLSDSIVQAFRNDPAVSKTQILDVAPAGMITPPVPVVNPAPVAPTPADLSKEKRRKEMKGVARDIRDVLAPLVSSGKVRVRETSRGVTIEISDSILFSPGQALLSRESEVAMRLIAEVLAGGDFPITIEGHTDNLPISTPLFPSNWELSAVRATTVLRLFVAAGISPGRLTAIGYGDTRPVAGNEQAEGRAQNRRVSIQVDSSAPDPGKELPLEAPRESAPSQ